jgi:hypothetical protein
MMKRLALGATLALALLLRAALLVFKLLHGGGKAHPDISTEPLIPQAGVETLVSLEFPAGNVSVANDDGIFLAYPRSRRHTGSACPRCSSWAAASPSPTLMQASRSATKACSA